jgi:hypothetical protein
LAAGEAERLPVERQLPEPLGEPLGERQRRGPQALGLLRAVALRVLRGELGVYVVSRPFTKVERLTVEVLLYLDGRLLVLGLLALTLGQLATTRCFLDRLLLCRHQIADALPALHYHELAIVWMFCRHILIPVTHIE